MSHAAVLVALDALEIERAGSIEEAIAFQMLPFDENGEWFRDGSRWDWYSIGGRFTGMLADYDPEKDPANTETCTLCGGTGTRTDMSVADGCNGCQGKGVRVKWPTQWKEFEGDIVRVSMLDAGKFQPSGAFLRNRHWHENERMGWFGVPAYTECERKDMEKPTANPDNWSGKCLHKDEELEARVICWNEPWEIWKEAFYKRFIQPLPPDTTLAVVDYHV